jgi:hypothetical protein
MCHKVTSKVIIHLLVILQSCRLHWSDERLIWKRWQGAPFQSVLPSATEVVFARKEQCIKAITS